MPIETKKLPVEVSAIRIDGKKITKSVFKQIVSRSLLGYVLTPLLDHDEPYDLESLLSRAESLDITILGRHSFEIAHEDYDIHIIWYEGGELFVDVVNPEMNALIRYLENMDEKLSRLKHKLFHANTFIEDGSLNLNVWMNILKVDSFLGSLQNCDQVEQLYDYLCEIDSFYAHHINSTENFEKYKSDFFSENLDAEDALLDEARSISQKIVAEHPSKISKLESQISDVESCYDSWIKKVNQSPKIIIGI